METAGQSSSRRADLVRAAVGTWRGQLIDLSWRNQLLYYRDLRYGTLDLADADFVMVEQLLGGKSVRLSRMFRRSLFADRLKRARTIRNKAREASEERGIAIGYLAVGMATWTNPQGAAVPAAPILLQEAVITATGAAEDDFEIDLAGDPHVNPALVHLLDEQFHVRLEATAVQGALEDGIASPAAIFDIIRVAAAEVPGFSIGERRVLGTFSYTKLPMVHDLANNVDALIRHDVVAAIAGDRAAADAIAAAGADVELDEPDRLSPDDEYLVLDADSSQSYVINAAVAGQSMVVSGPPGTGKSQTIANLIATLVAQGQSVLFVAEKRAAISAVLDRLGRVGLGDIAFDVHDGGGARAAMIAALTAGFTRPPRANASVGAQLEVRRRQLNAHDTAMNGPRSPWGISVFAGHEALLGLTERFGNAAVTEIRFGPREIVAMDEATASIVREELREYANLGGLSLSVRDSPWAGAPVVTTEQAEHALQVATRLRSATVPETWQALDEVAAQSGLRPPATLAGWRTLLQLFDRTAEILTTLDTVVWSTDLAQLVAATASRSQRRALGDFDGKVGELRAAANRLWLLPDKPPRKQLHRTLVRAHELATEWSGVTTAGVPKLPTALPTATAKFAELDSELDELAALLPWLDMTHLPRPQLAQTVEALAHDARTLHALPRMNTLAATFSALGMDPLLAQMRSRRADPDLAVAMYDSCWFSSVLDQVSFDDPVVATFNGALHDLHAEQFRAADAAHIRTSAARVLDKAVRHLETVAAQHPEQQRVVTGQAARKRGHLSLRQLFSAAPDMLTALKPCWAMSPLVVSQLLPGDRPYFDVVVFDEASQIVPADAISAISRARRVIVAGDNKQLPPTQFFAVDSEDKAEQVINDDGSINLALTIGFESILDVLTAALGATRVRSLTWHYRSRDERLIAFSNSWVYGNSLTTFPGVSGSDCLSHELVRQQRGGADEDSAAAEVERVVAMVLQHAKTRPHESLGVITMGINHMERIDARLREKLRARPSLRGFFDEPAGEPFFVKNLERVQGDERDAIILSIGYAKRADGSLSHNFGPLNQEGGHRRLNVAITRARSRMTLVSSFSHTDMDPERSTAPGVAMLRAYLRYTRNRGEVGNETAEHATQLSPFEVSVRDKLTAAGMPVVPQYGVAGDHIGFAIADSRRPDAMVLAVEADTAAYHCAATVRDRDRLRQEQLQRLGWGYHRFWSADWFIDSAGCVARAQAAYVRALGTEVAPGRPVTDYTDGELVLILQNIVADGKPRTDDELFKEFMAALGFAKKGQRIRAAFERAAGYARIGRG
ncbi:DUF4011 domain-containing protein [Skermania sp. ID1734]|uniref:AAA domain-containing protein n=1 Tax=Skermania sp. ID1734 TaxID=2597516 RepID=UPI00117C4E4F|nr:AAA domain-containing protein [Skermania sp. ID1734]TSD95366.1 DUF4011 domain-containing protein [Skermania sp. ID1734]